ncbi:MAG: dehydrogenase [Bdellovibrio sp.]|nr:MAG: dehydrogenase [Bdellovibrio sp.]
MFRIAEINFGQSANTENFQFELGGKPFEVQTFNVNFSTAYTKELIRSLRSQVDAIALTSLPVHFRAGNRTFVHPDTLEILTLPTSIPLCDGHHLREISVVSGLQNMLRKDELRIEQGVFISSGILNRDAVRFLCGRPGAKVAVGDLCTMMGIPYCPPPNWPAIAFAKLMGFYGATRDVRHFSPLNHSLLHRLGQSCLPALARPYHYVFTGPQFLSTLGHNVDYIRGKIVIFPYLPSQLRAQFESYSPEKLVDLFPEKLRVHPHMTYSVADACLRLTHGRKAVPSMQEWFDLLELGEDFRSSSRPYFYGARPSTQARFASSVGGIQKRISGETAPDFAFIVHALSKKDFARVPGFRWLEDTPKFVLDNIERLAAKGPGFVYGRIQNIVSQKTGEPISGILYSLPATPRMLREQAAEVTYKKIEKICYDAQGRGAKIIGLGAYTKVIGDQGATIHQLSPIPVTTGNSLSASATLWALKEAVRKMGFLKFKPNSKIVEGTAMVIGATGSIGSVSAKLLALAFARVVLVAPRLERLQDLQREIKIIAPECEVIVTTDANELAGKADAVVTATSAFDQKVVEVETLKPGCVVCDCSRPLDFSIQDAMKRPDVLIIESGEVVIPGPIKMNCDLGLPKNVFYACLAETAVLAMEHRYEPFTLGREIEWEKVREMYRLSRQHGVALAAIRGHSGVVSDREIELVRARARARARARVRVKG